MDADSETVKYLQNLIRDAVHSAEAEYLLRLAVRHHIESIPYDRLVKIAGEVLDAVEEMSYDE